MLTTFEKIIIKNNNPIGTSILLLLTWIAYSDEHLDPNELNNLFSVAKESNHRNDIDSIISLAKSSDFNAIQLASEILKIHLDKKKGILFLQMAIGMAFSDNKINITENYIIRFIADLFGFTRNEINAIYKNICGNALLEPEDFSSSKYWSGSDKNYDKESQKQKIGTAHLSKEKSLAILGLDEGATIEEIKKTYWRLSQVHHPDKYVSLGEEAVKAATLTFQRITAAYNYLLNNA